MITQPLTPAPVKKRYDAVIVGARPAGAATGMLLARAGLDVLVIDRARRGQDTLSSHALMRGAVDALDRWGVLPGIVGAGTPAITRTTFRYGSDTTRLDIEPLYAPRRTVLDPLMADAAAAAGATIRYETAAAGLRRDDRGRVAGLLIDQAAHDATGSSPRLEAVDADIVIGADGLRSWVARQVDAPVTRSGSACASWMMTYVEGADLPNDGYVWAAAEGLLGGIIPTNHGQHILFAGMPRERFVSSVRGRADEAYLQLMAELGDDMRNAAVTARRVGPLRTFPGHVSQFRKAFGPGWALVGDAGYFKDPAAAHGISDAVRDAELLTEAVLEGDLENYERQRNDLSTDLFDALERIAGFDWTLDELPGLHRTLAKTMRDELTAFTSRRRPAVLAAA